MQYLNERTRHFPVSVHPIQHAGKLDDAYNSHRMVFSQSKSADKLVVAPYLHDFGFRVEDVALVPALFGTLHDARSKFTKLLGRGEIPDAHQIDLSERGYLSMSSRAAIESLMPDASIEELGPGFKVVQGLREDVYRRVGGEVPKETDNRERLQGESLLTPALRAILEQYGTIVYESDPRGADRLVVGVKHVHGMQMSSWELAGFDLEAAGRFNVHQKEIVNSIDESTDHLGARNTNLFLETFPEIKEDGSESEEFAKMLLFYSDLQQATQQLNRRETPLSKQALSIYESNTRAHFMQMAINKGSVNMLRGDGRVPTEAKQRESQAKLEFDAAMTRVRGGGVGTASNIVRRGRAQDTYVFTQSQKQVVANVAKHSRKGGTDFLIYGGGHFASGTPSKDNGQVLFEEMLSLIPRTQVVIMEPRNYSNVLDDFGRYGKALCALSHNEKLILVSVLDELHAMTISIQRSIMTRDTRAFFAESVKVEVLIKRIQAIFHSTKLPADVSTEHADVDAVFDNLGFIGDEIEFG